MTLNDTLIKLTIADYTNTKSDKYITKFQELTYYFVKSWPYRQYKCNEDICSDFLLFILESTEEILNSYPKNLKVAFKTWFSGVLYNKYNDFCKTGKVPEQDFNLADPEYEVYTKSLEDNNEIFDLLEITKEMLGYEESLILFYYKPHSITGRHIKLISEYFNSDILTILEIYKDMVKYQEECFQYKNFYEKKLDLLDHKIAHSNNIILNTEDKNIIENLKIKLIRMENRKYKYLQKLKCIDKNSLKIFSKLFTDYNSAYRMKKKLEIGIKRKLQ